MARFLPPFPALSPSNVPANFGLGWFRFILVANLVQRGVHRLSLLLFAHVRAVPPRFVARLALSVRLHDVISQQHCNTLVRQQRKEEKEKKKKRKSRGGRGQPNEAEERTKRTHCHPSPLLFGSSSVFSAGEGRVLRRCPQPVSFESGVGCRGGSFCVAAKAKMTGQEKKRKVDRGRKEEKKARESRSQRVAWW